MHIRRRSLKKLADEHCLIFYHIEKTAGTTFNQILMREYKADNLYHLYGSRRKEDIKRFLTFSTKQKNQIRCITGHMSHLLEDHLPKPVKYVTFLRDPLTQVISSYQYQHNVQRTKGYKLVKDVNSLDEYLDWQIQNRRDNIQTRYLSDSVRFLENMTGQVSMQRDGRIYYKKALRRLDEISLVFITEEFNKAVLTMANLLSWHRTPYYSELNRSPQSKSISTGTERRIREVHRYDFELYEQAKKIHQRLISEQINLDERLISFEKWNGLNSRIINTANQIREIPGGKTLINILSSLKGGFRYR